MAAREAHLDKRLHKRATLNARDIKQLVVAILGAGRQRGAVRDLPAPAYFIAAAHGNTSIGVAATSNAVLEALENAEDDHNLGRPGPDARDDGHAIVDDETLGVATIVAEKGVVDHLLVLDLASLVPLEIRIRRDEGQTCLQGSDDGRGWERSWDWHPGDDNKGLWWSHCDDWSGALLGGWMCCCC